MHNGKFIFSQIMSFIDPYEFYKCVKQFKGDERVRSFSCWNQFLCMSFGQLTHRESLRDIIICLEAHQNNMYHLGINYAVAKSTLADANESRNWKIYAEFARVLIKQAIILYKDDKELSFDFEGAVYLIDSTTIDLCLKTFRWAKFRKHKGAVKLHTMMNLQGSIPNFIYITNGKIHDVNVLDEIEFEAGSFYVMDKGYVDFSRLYNIKETGAFFLVRAKDNLSFKRISSIKVDKSTGVIVDQQIQMLGYYTSKYYPEILRRIKYYDADTRNTLLFLTDNFKLNAVEIAELYKHRWNIELFFKWIKQHLKVLKFWGYSENSVKTQIWIAISTYVLVAIIKKKLNIKHSLNEILQILSVSVLMKMPVQQLFERKEFQNENGDSPNQLKLF